MSKFVKCIAVVVMVLFMASSVFAQDVAWEVVHSGRKVVPTPGTAVALVDGVVPTQQVIVTALTNDTGIVCVGGPEVLADEATRTGTPLAAGESVTLPVSNVGAVYIDAFVADEGVTYSYFTSN